MDNYYEYFVAKGNHPNSEEILNQETRYSFSQFTRANALRLGLLLVEEAQSYLKPIGIRIVIANQVVFQYFMDGIDIPGGMLWLEKKEKMCNLAGHSSYYAFLENMTTHKYDQCIHDESYGLCGGSFPIVVQNSQVGTITVTGCRPNEDHQIIVAGLEKLFQQI